MPDNTMRAVRYHRHGPPEVLVIEAVPRPEPGDGEVLVRVHAAGVNPVDGKLRSGAYPSDVPATTGADLAGVVAMLGPGVTAFREGDAVYGIGNATNAEYAVIAAGALAPKPRNLSFDEAAAVPVGARTAWAALIELADIQPGQRVLIHGAAGGVGIWAVQFGRWKGAHVIGTASAENLDFLRSLGAQEAIDYKATPFENVVHDVDAVLDSIGGQTQARSWQVLRPGGILVTLVAPASADQARQHGVRTAHVVPSPTPGDTLRQVGKLLEAGTVRPVIQQVFPMEEVRQAHALLDTGQGRGRIVLHIAD